MMECDYCGSPVTDEFHRVFEVDGRLLACIECCTGGNVMYAIQQRRDSR
ncbi:DUF7563 family protein [Halorussus limi]